MSTWLSKMNNGGMSGGMKKEPILPGLNTSAAKVSKTKAVDAAKIAKEGQEALDKADAKDLKDTSYITKPSAGKVSKTKGKAADGKKAATSNTPRYDYHNQKRIARDGQDALDKADAAEVADTSYITKPTHKTLVPTDPKPKKKANMTSNLKPIAHRKHQEYTPPPAPGKIAPMIASAVINAIASKKK